MWDLARSAAPPFGVATDESSRAVKTGIEGVCGGAVAAILGRHGSAALGCDWQLSAPSMLASCGAGGGVRVWG